MNETTGEAPAATEVLISLGSNVERERNIAEAVRRLRRHPDLVVVATSRIFESDAVGGEYPPYYNCAVRAISSVGPEALRTRLRAIEAQMGRVRTQDVNAPRTIDLDISVFGEWVRDFDGWQVPDPDIVRHAHVATPLADVAPELVHPAEGLTLAELVVKMARLSDTAEQKVRPAMAVHLSLPHQARSPEDLEGAVGEVYAPHFESLVRQQLVEIGEDPDREGLARTPLRVAKAMDFLTSGYTMSLEEVVNDAVFDAEGADEMVLVKDIEFYSMCEHHMLPFFGTASVAYLPRGTIIGLSKIARLTDLYARRLQVQERMTNQIADALIEVLDPHGVAVVVEGKHFCMMMRGVQKQDRSMVTSAMRGTFQSDARTRSEFLDLVRG